MEVTIVRPQSIYSRRLWAFAACVALFAVAFDFLGTGLSVYLVKYLLLAALGLGCVGWGVWMSVRDGFILPRSGPFALACMLLGIGAVSALLNGRLTSSWSGSGYESDTLSALISLCAVGVVGGVVYGTPHGMRFLAALIIAIFCAVTTLEIIDLAFFPFLSDRTASVVGSWATLGVFYGAFVLLWTVLLEWYRPQGARKRAMSAALLVSVFMFVVTGSLGVWKIVAAYLCCIYVWRLVEYLSARSARIRSVLAHVRLFNFDQIGTFPVYAFGVLLFALIMILSVLPNYASYVQVRNQSELRPSFSDSVAVARGVYAEGAVEMLFGKGPNTFVENWNLYRPKARNVTELWNRDSRLASSFLMTYAVTMGSLGALGTLLLFVYVHVDMARALHRAPAREQAAIPSALSVFASYGWILILFSVPGPVMLTLTALATGAFVGHVSLRRYIARPRISWRYARVFFLTLLVCICVYGTIQIITRARASLQYARSISALHSGDIARAEQAAHASASLVLSDYAFRALSEIYQRQAAELVKRNSPSEELNARLNDLLQHSLDAAQESVATDPHNYLNYLAVGNVYTALAWAPTTEVQSAAAAVYTKAISLNPTSPAPHFLYGRFLMLSGQKPAAQHELDTAVALKRDYGDAKELLKKLNNE